MRFKPRTRPKFERRKKSLARPAIPMHFPLVRRHNRLRRDFRVLPVASISLALSQLSPTYIYIYIYIPIYSRSVPPVRFTAFPPRCIHKTNPNSHGVVLMPGERMRNAYACTARIPVATGSMSSLCPCVNTRPRALSLSRATRARVAFVRGYGLEGCALRGVVGIPQAVAFLPTFRGVKMCPRRAGRVGNCFAPPIPALVPRDPSRLPSRPFRYGKGDGIKSFPANERFFLSVSSSLFSFFFFASHLFFCNSISPSPFFPVSRAGRLGCRSTSEMKKHAHASPRSLCLRECFFSLPPPFA